MKKSEPFFAQLDQWLFQQTDRFGQSIVAQKWNELISSLDEQKQKVVNQSVSLALTFLPLAIFMVMTITNCSLKNEIQDKKIIIQEIDRLTNSKGQLDDLARPMLAPIAIADQNLLEQRLKIHLDRDNIALEKVVVTDFNNIPLSSEMSQAQATLTFKSFTLADFTNVLSSLITREKMILTDLEVSKDEKTEMLFGTIGVNSFSRNRAKD